MKISHLINQSNGTLSKIFKPFMCGWRPHSERTPSENTVNDNLIAAMPRFALQGKSAEPRDGKSLLWEGTRSIRNGRDLECFYQLEGSCVGEGKAMTEWYIMHMEVLRGDPETPILPYMPYGYGMSRVCAGINSRSHGSTGTGAAEAAKKYGVLRSDLPGLPKWKVEDRTIIWGSHLESMWMNGAPQDMIAKGQKHLIRTTALVRNTDELRDGLINKYAATCASSWGGMMRPPVRGSGANARLLNTRVDTWNHQMMICGWEDNPELGELYYVQNSWSQDVHGVCPSGAPLGGFWVNKRDMQMIISEQETFLYSQFDGFPSDMIPWIF